MTNSPIFLVDDDPYWTALLIQLLANQGFHNILCFSSGTDCIKNLHLHPVLVFLDYRMDEMDGLEVLQRIKAYDHSIGVIFCTAYEDLSVALDAIKHGSYDYLLKGNVNQKEVGAILAGMADYLELASQS